MNYLVSDIAWLNYDQSKENWASLAMAAIFVVRYEQKTVFLQIFKILPLIHIWTMSEFTCAIISKDIKYFLEHGSFMGFPKWQNIDKNLDIIVGKLEKMPKVVENKSSGN